MNFTLLTFDILDSTNSEALKQAKLGATEGLCIVSRQQTAGRGRYGRTWVSDRDAGLYFSIVLRPKLDVGDLPLITLMAGVAVYDTLAEIGTKPDIKWVNDVHVNDKKIAGILAETTETEAGLAVVVGIGINLTSANFSPDLVATATSVEDALPKKLTRKQLIEVLTRQLENSYDMLRREGGAAKIIENWKLRSSYTSGKLVRVGLESETLIGMTDGLENNGALRIKLDDDTVVIVQAGDVERVRAAF